MQTETCNDEENGSVISRCTISKIRAGIPRSPQGEAVPRPYGGKVGAVCLQNPRTVAKDPRCADCRGDRPGRPCIYAAKGEAVPRPCTHDGRSNATPLRFFGVTPPNPRTTVHCSTVGARRCLAPTDVVPAKSANHCAPQRRGDASPLQGNALRGASTKSANHRQKSPPAHRKGDRPARPPIYPPATARRCLALAPAMGVATLRPYGFSALRPQIRKPLCTVAL